jgi:hypothetical protein
VGENSERPFPAGCSRSKNAGRDHDGRKGKDPVSGSAEGLSVHEPKASDPSHLGQESKGDTSKVK